MKQTKKNNHKLLTTTMLSCLILCSLLFLTSCTTTQEVPEIRLGNEGFLYEAESDVAVLLIHGLSASPWEFRELGEFLVKKNITSYAILLPGHGTNLKDFKDSNWEDWYEHSKQALEYLKESNKEVFVGGVSLGASLSLLLAEEYDVTGVISISSPIYLQNVGGKYANILQYVTEYTETNLTEEEKLYYYDKKPLRSVDQLNELIKIYNAGLNKVTEPILILQAEQDKTIQPYSAAIIYEKVSSANKQIKWFKTTKHVLTKSEHKQEVFDSVYGFIKEISKEIN